MYIFFFQIIVPQVRLVDERYKRIVGFHEINCEFLIRRNGKELVSIITVKKRLGNWNRGFDIANPF